MPVPAEPAVFSGVTIALAAPCARWSLRARDAALLEKVTGLKLPRKIGEVVGETVCLGPDEWLTRAPAGATLPDGAGEKVAVVDIAERALTLTLSGPAAARVIAAGCPRDVERLPFPYASRTVFEGVEVLLQRDAEDAFTIEVWRSFAPWLWTALTQAAADMEHLPA
ncbi:MAG: sarcosine oxidase gamma subunit [Proteobacteria bacterium]|nr:sarcosine oxidase gamma subunit [Pseudomonadota bacterium]